MDDDDENVSVANLNVPESKNFNKVINSVEEKDISSSQIESVEETLQNELPESSNQDSDSEDQSLTTNRLDRKRNYEDSKSSMNSEGLAQDTVFEDEEENKEIAEEIKSKKQVSRQGTIVSYASKDDFKDGK